MAATSSPPNSFNMSTSGFPPNPPLKLEELHHCIQALKFFKGKRTHQLSLIKEEFINLKGHVVKPSVIDNICSVANLHSEKNRYPDVVPYDSHRIVVGQCKDDMSSAMGYINASLITTEVNPSESVSRFIATQGPLPETFDDFWEMVVENHCPAIVMLTRLDDGNEIDKCDDYFQAENGVRLFRNNLQTITKKITTTNSLLVLSELEVNHGEDGHHPVFHIQYPEWPDQGVPTDTSAVRDIFRRLRHLPSSKGPILVHCSAGVGRTGTYCVIHNTIQRILTGDMSALNLVETIITFRSQRMRMVQRYEQYKFCYDAIIAELEDLILGSNNEEGLK